MRWQPGAWALSMMMLMASPMLAEAQDSSEVRQKVEDALAAIRDYSIEQKDAAVAQGKELLRQLDQEVGEAESQTNEAESEAKTQWQTTLDQLRELRAQAGEQLTELGDSSAEMWDRVKAGFADAAAALNQKLQDLTDEPS